MYSEVPWRLIRSLSRKKERDRTGLTVAEGPSVVLAAVEAGVELQALVFAEEFADSERHTRSAKPWMNTIAPAKCL